MAPSSLPTNRTRTTSELPALQPGQVLEACWRLPGGASASLFGELREQHGPELLLGPTESWPTDLPLRGQQVDLKLYAADGLHQSPARVVGEPDPDGLRLSLSGLDERLQRRRYERARVELRAAAALLGGAGEPPLTFPARLVDLSAGGVRFVCPVQVQPDSRVVLRLMLDQEGPLLVTARVIRVGDEVGFSEAAEGGLHLAGAEFVALEPPERSRLFQYVRRRLAAERRSALNAASSAANRG